MSFPSSLDSLPNTRSVGDSGPANDNNNMATAVMAVEAKVGADSSAVTTSLDYMLKNSSSINPGHKHTSSSIQGLKLPTFIVSASGGDYTTIQGALDAATSGGIIYLTDSSYTITTGLLFKASYQVIVGNSKGTTIQCDGSVVPTLIKANSTTYKECGVRGVKLLQTNGTPQGVGLDNSNMSLSMMEDIHIESFGTGIKMNDTANNTFYNTFRNIKIFVCNTGIDITSTNPVNDNGFYNIRTDVNASGTALIMTNGQGNSFYNFEAEPESTTSTKGINLSTANVIDTAFYGCWIEGNAVGITIASAVIRTLFVGGTITANTSNSADSSLTTTYVGTRIGSTGTTTIQPATFLDGTNASQTFLFSDNTSFAHTGSQLVDVLLQNGSDGSKAVRVRNAGTGLSASFEDNSGNLKASVGQNGEIVSKARVTSKQATLTDGATVALDASLGNSFYLAAAGDRTLSIPTNLVEGQEFVIVHMASGGARTLTLTVAGAGCFRFGSTITGLTQTASGKTDYIFCRYNSTDGRCDVVNYVKGYVG